MKGRVLIIVSDEQFFLEIQKKKKLKQSCFTFFQTGLDWLRSDSDQNVGWLLGSIQSQMWTHEQEQKKNKRGVVCISSLFIIERERRKGGRRKKNYYKTIGRQVGADNYEALTNQICGEMVLLFFFSFFLPNRNKKRISSGKTTLKRWLSPIFYIFRDRLENSAPSEHTWWKFLLSFKMWSKGKSKCFVISTSSYWLKSKPFKEFRSYRR